MIVHDLEQRSPEWFALRLGKPTASAFDKLITPTGKPSSQAEAYANFLLAEWITGQPGGMEPNQWMQRGTDTEPEARAYYELEAGAQCREVGFITTDCERIGCSPDALVDSNGMLEIKVPAPHTHVEYLLSGSLPPKYKPQVQGQLYVAERDWCDFLSYHADMPPVLVRVARDEAFIKELARILDDFCDRLERKRQTLIQRGIQPTAEAA